MSEYKRIKNCCDVTECLGNEEVWQAARAKNKELKKRLQNRLTPEHIYTYHVDWTDKGQVTSGPFGFYKHCTSQMIFREKLIPFGAFSFKNNINT